MGRINYDQYSDLEAKLLIEKVGLICDRLKISLLNEIFIYRMLDDGTLGLDDLESLLSKTDEDNQNSSSNA